MGSRQSHISMTKWQRTLGLRYQRGIGWVQSRVQRKLSPDEKYIPAPCEFHTEQLVFLMCGEPEMCSVRHPPPARTRETLIDGSSVWYHKREHKAILSVTNSRFGEFDIT
jgi:hypothetical protein